MKYVFNEITHYRFPTHVNDLVMDRAEAETSEAFMVVLQPGEAPPLHKHDDTEQVFYILEGAGTLQIEEDKFFDVKVGDVVRIPPRTYHAIKSQGKTALRYLSVDCFLNGRPKDEPTWDSHVRVVCKNFGWKFEDVKLQK
jgi:mannose-6-phosphate isomerase-like protein (cupin superfamily)